MFAVLEKTTLGVTTPSDNKVDPLVVTGKANLGGPMIFTFSDGGFATYDGYNAPFVSRDGTTPGQLDGETVALRFALAHVNLLSNATDAVGQQAYANMVAGIATEWLALFGHTGTSTIAQPALPDGTAISPVTVTSMRNELSHGSWYIDSTAGQPGGVGSNVYDRNTGSWSVYITPDAVNKYAGLDGGMPYLIAHEMGHDSSGGLAAQDYFLAHWQAEELSHGVAYGPDSYNWVNNEVYANLVAQNITNLVGLAFIDSPRYGLVFH
jgi:hypothetical protein